MKRVGLAALVLVLLVAGCTPGAKKPPAPPGAGAGDAPAVPPEVSASLGEAKRAFLAGFKEEAIYGRAPGTAGFQYPEKEALREIPAGSLLAGIKGGLANAKSLPEIVFWLDLFSLVPDQAPGASEVLLDYIVSLPPEGDRYLAYQVAHTHLGRLMGEQDAASLFSTLGRYDEGLQYMMLAVLRGKGMLTAEKMVELLAEPGVDAQAVMAHLDPVTAGVLSLLGKDFTRFTTKAQVVVAERVGHLSKWGPDEGLKKDAVSWLNSMLGKSGEPAVRQEILYQVYQATDSKESLDRLVAEVEKNGAAPGLHIWGNHSFLRDIRSNYPGSYLARGFAAYEKVRGRPYFVLDFWDPMRNDPWPFKYGSEQYEPAREIPGWLEFLEDFSRHPGADDAAYRLGRCYEIQGKWEEALTWLAKATFLPDGDLDFDSRGRLLFVLDGRVPPAELERLAGDPEIIPELKPLIEYTLAVRDIRDEDYQRASDRLGTFIERYGDKGAGATGDLLLGGAVGLRYPFWARVREQKGWVSHLAEQTARLKADSSNPEALYQLGAEIYRNQFIYYNFLWAGARQGFNWVGHINELWDEVPEKQAYLQGLINHQHALKYFEAVEKSPQATGDLKAKALYSQGLAYIGILQWGLDSETVLGAESIKGKIVDTYGRFVETYPGSSMADDALLTLYAYTKDKAYLERLLKEYPDGDRVDSARKMLAGSED